MKKAFFSLFSLWATIVSSSIAGGGVELRNITLDDIGMGGRMMRISDNGNLFIDEAGICLEGHISLRVTGHNGQRLFCIVAPIAGDGELLADNYGEAMNINAFKVNSTQGNKVRFRIPYTWLDLENKRTQISFYVSVVNADFTEIGNGTISLDPHKINIDTSNMPERMLGDILGGNDRFGLGDLFLGMMGANTASIKKQCISCDGSGLCPQCDGMGFFKPSICNRCSHDPGICRRCKGAKIETTRISY